MTLAVAAVIAGALVAPHAVRLDDTPPPVAATIWMAALALRALAAVFVAIFVVLYLPATQLFVLISHWCWHTVVPFITEHLAVNGHAFGDVAIIAPSFVLAISLMSVALGLWRAARQVRKLVLRSSLGHGPGQSVILRDGQILVAAAGLRRPQVLVSAGALTVLDDEELAVSLEHERGHIARHHRYVLLAAELCRGLGRFVPGARRAAAELLYHLERDADRYALRRAHDPAALASAICKAAQGSALGAPAFGLSGGFVTRRVQALLDGRAGHQDRCGRGATALATALVALVLGATAALPPAVAAGLQQASALPAQEHCLD